MVSIIDEGGRERDEPVPITRRLQVSSHFSGTLVEAWATLPKTSPALRAQVVSMKVLRVNVILKVLLDDVVGSS